MEDGILHAGEKAKRGMIEDKGNALEALAKPACSQ